MSTNSENETSAEKRQDNGRPQFLRSRLMGGNVLQGYAEFSPGPTLMTLGEEWVLCRAPAFDELLKALKEAREVVEADCETDTGPLEAPSSKHSRKVLARIDAAIHRAEGGQ